MRKVLEETLRTVALAIKDAGGHALLVGGAVRDMLQGIEVKDLDVEVYGISPDELLEIAQLLGRVSVCGRSFAVMKVTIDGGERVQVDLSLPRVENKTGPGHRDFTVEGKPELSVEQAAERRDFTINSMGWDILTNELLDPFGGREDLARGTLRATSEKFGEDPLRVLRGVQFASRFNLRMDDDTVRVCKDLVFEFDTLSTDRVREEWLKWARGKTPSAGLKVLLETDWLQWFPEIEALRGTPQDHIRHPKGWSISIKDSSSTINPGLTSTTETMTVNGRSFLLWEIFPFSLAEKTMIPRVSGTSDTESFVSDTIDCLPTALLTGTLNSLSAPDSLVTNGAKSPCFVWSFLSADPAHKTVRIMFRVPLCRMHRVMERSVNDFEVFRKIVHSVTIFVVDMFSSMEGPTKNLFHDVSMETDAVPFTGNSNILISRVAMDGKPFAVNDDILFHLDLTFIPDIHNVSLPVKDSENDTTHHVICQVTIGDVWEHTLQVVDAVARAGGNEAVVFAALLHDIGKAHTTEIGDDGRLHSFGHAQKGAELARAFMERLEMPEELTEKVVKLVGAHMWHLNGVDKNAARRWSRKIVPATMGELIAVVEADCLGRGEASMLPWQVIELRRAVEEAGVINEEEKSLLLGRHLLALGMVEGKEIGAVLREALEEQLERGWTTLAEAQEWARNRV